MRSGRVLERDFFVLCFHIKVFRVLLTDLLGFVGPQGARRGPNWSLSGTLRGQIKGKFGALMATWFQGAPRGPKRDQFGVILGCLLESF